MHVAEATKKSLEKELAKERDERSRQKSRVFSKLLEMLNSEEIEGQKSKKESVINAVNGLVRLLERGVANEAEKEAMTGDGLSACGGAQIAGWLLLIATMPPRPSLHHPARVCPRLL